MTDVEKYLIKKAKGFRYKEVVEEYDADGNLLKRKLYDKYAPPDVTAIKAAGEMREDVSGLTDARLEELREQLLQKRKQEEV